MKIPQEAKEYIWGALEDGAKVFLFENFNDEKSFFVEHSDGDVTIVSWPDIGEAECSYLNIDKNIRNDLAKDLSFEG